MDYLSVIRLVLFLATISLIVSVLYELLERQYARRKERTKAKKKSDTKREEQVRPGLAYRSGGSENSATREGVIDSSETLYYQDEAVRITNAGAVFGAKTYTLTSISSAVLMKQSASRSWGFLAVFAGIVGAAVGVLAVLNARFNYTFVAGCFASSLILVIVGLAMLIKMHATYIVRLTTTSGEIDAMHSTDENRAKHIVRAINAVILDQG